MKIYFIVSFFLIIPIYKSDAQTIPARPDLSSLREAFKKSKNDSLFISNHSDYVYQIDTVHIYMPGSYLYPTDSLCDLAKKGDVIGPFEDEQYEVLIKIVGSADGYFMRVSHILLGRSNGASDEDLTATGNLIIDKLNTGVSFATLAIEFGQDGSAARGGDLGWFGQNVMVTEFEQAILKHKKGDYFLVWTEFGLHVVKITEDFKKGKQQIYIVRLIRDKK
ncbi:MAG: peptidylprolyl isomerase [Chitinophagaceae bacterium]|nr:peptidylprolyl isomerase [Chitinophagaceae bacterium]